MPNALATADGTSDGSVSGASSTHQMPSLKESIKSVAAWIAKRVLPLPPAPVSVTRRVFDNNCLICDSSRVRPTKLEIGIGRFVTCAANEGISETDCLIQ